MTIILRKWQQAGSHGMEAVADSVHHIDRQKAENDPTGNGMGY